MDNINNPPWLRASIKPSPYREQSYTTSHETDRTGNMPYTPFANSASKNLKNWPSEKLFEEIDDILANPIDVREEYDFVKLPWPVELERLNLSLKIAVENDNSSLIIEVIDFGANPNCIYSDGSTPLFLCAAHDNLACFNALISKGACPEMRNARGLSALHLAISQENLQMMQALIKLKPEIFNLLNTKGVSTRKTFNPLYIAIFFDSATILRYFFTETHPALLENIISQCFPLHVATAFARLKSVEVLLEFINVNHKNKVGDTPLTLIAKIFLRNKDKKIGLRFKYIEKQLIQHSRPTPFFTSVQTVQKQSFESKTVHSANLLLPDSVIENINVKVTPTPVSSRRIRNSYGA